MDDSTQVMAFTGFVAGAVAVLAWAMDRRRMRRSDPDRVGFMPWTPIFFWALMASVLLLGIAARDWIAGWQDIPIVSQRPRLP
jgi:hypothetical protein